MKKTINKQSSSEEVAEGFRVLFDQYFERLFLFAKRMVKSEEAAKDVVSEVFLACWKNAANVLEMQDVRAYLYTATRHECIRHVRRQVQARVPDFMDLPEERYLMAIEHYTPEDAVLFEELQKVIEQAVESLPPQCKAVYKLVKDDGLTHEEAAKVMNISPNTVKNQVVKALGVAREAVERYLAKEKRGGATDAKIVYLKTLAILLLAAKIF